MGYGFPFVERLAAWASWLTVLAPEKHYPIHCSIVISYFLNIANLHSECHIVKGEGAACKKASFYTRRRTSCSIKRHIYCPSKTFFSRHFNPASFDHCTLTLLQLDSDASVAECEGLVGAHAGVPEDAVAGVEVALVLALAPEMRK